MENLACSSCLWCGYENELNDGFCPWCEAEVEWIDNGDVLPYQKDFKLE